MRRLRLGAPAPPAALRPYLTDPEGPLAQGAYTSPLRSERVAAALGVSLGVLFTTCFATGMFSHLQQHPVSWLPIPPRPAGLFRVTQGIHVAAGIASLPVLLAKLWVVWPRFVSWPPVNGAGHALERLALLPLVAGGLFLVGTGIANVAQWYPWRFSFTAAHYQAAVIVIGALLVHIAHQAATTRTVLAKAPRRTGRRTSPAPEDTDGRLSRRGFLGAVAGTSGLLTAVTLGQTFPPLRRLALLAPRDPASGPQGRPVNRSAANASVIDRVTSPEYRLVVEGRVARPLSLTRDELLALPSRTARLPIACVEGWSYDARWTGVRIRDLMAMAGAAAGASVRIESIEQGPYGASVLNPGQADDGDTMLATHLDGEPLHLDHGFPCRLIAPDRPGVLQTKWVTRVVVL